MPAFLEQKLKSQYGADSAVPYKIMSKLGLIRGQKETPKGRALQARHDRDVAAGRARKPGGRIAMLMGKARAAQALATATSRTGEAMAGSNV